MITQLKTCTFIVLLMLAKTQAENRVCPFSFQFSDKHVNTVVCDIKRFQKFKNIVKTGTGKIAYDKKIGFVYEYRTPMKFAFFKTDSTLRHINLAKGWGRVARTNDCEISRSDHLLGWYLDYVDTSIIYEVRASADSLMLLTKDNCIKSIVDNLLIDRSTYALSGIERFWNGQLVEQVKFAYDNKKIGVQFPSSICIKRHLGSELLVDSLIFSNIKVHAAIPKERFEAPDTIIYR